MHQLDLFVNTCISGSLYSFYFFALKNERIKAKCCTISDPPITNEYMLYSTYSVDIIFMPDLFLAVDCWMQSPSSQTAIIHYQALFYHLSSEKRNNAFKPYPFNYFLINDEEKFKLIRVS